MRQVLLVWSANPFCKTTPFGMKQRVKNFLDELALRGYKIDQFRSGNYSTTDWQINPYGVVINPPEVGNSLNEKLNLQSWKKTIASLIPKALLPHLVAFYQKTKKNIKKLPPINFEDYAAIIFVTSGSIAQFDYLDQVAGSQKILLFERSEATWNSFGNETGDYLEKLKVEKHLSSKMNAIVHISLEEQTLFDTLLPNVESYLFPPSIDLQSAPYKDEKKYDFLLFGHDHENNMRGAKDFFRLLAQQKQKYTVLVAGAMAKKMRALDLDNVAFEDHVENLQKLYSKVSISVSFASVSDGVKTKVVESFSYGIPVLANKQGASGLLNKKMPGLHVVSEVADAFTWAHSILESESIRRETAKQLKSEVLSCYSEKNAAMAAKWVDARIIGND